MKETTDAPLITVLEVLLLETYPLLYTVSTFYSCLAGRRLSVLNYYVPVAYMKLDGRGNYVFNHFAWLSTLDEKMDLLG